MAAFRGPKLFCIPNPPASRNEALGGSSNGYACRQMGTRVAGSHGHPPTDGSFQFLRERHPCPQPRSPALLRELALARSAGTPGRRCRRGRSGRCRRAHLSPGPQVPGPSVPGELCSWTAAPAPVRAATQPLRSTHGPAMPLGYPSSLTFDAAYLRPSC